MADEVLVSFYESPVGETQAPKIRRTSKVYDIGTQFQVPSWAKLMKLQSREAAWWYYIGDSTAAATAETDDNEFMGLGDKEYIQVSGSEYVDTAADA